ncbi:MAG: BRO family protein [Sarcina sp.]
MNDLIVKIFKNKRILSFVWNNRPCWVAVDIADVFGYTQRSKSVADCIKREKFQLSIEYDVLEGERLKVFKEIFAEELGDTKYAPKVVIFYEEGLYGFLGYTEMPLGVEFRIWIRVEVMPTLRAKGYYVCDEKKMEVNYKTDTCNNEPKENNHNAPEGKIDKLKTAYDSAMMFKELLDDITLDSTYKFLLIKQIYLDAGIKLPRYIEEEKF